MITNSKINRQYNDLDEEYKKVPKRKWRFRLATFLWMTFSIVMMLILSSSRDNSREKILNKYLSTTDDKELISIYDNSVLRGNTQAFDWFQKNYLGINVNVAMAGVSWNCDGNKNNHNVIRNVEAYADDSSKLRVLVDGTKVFASKNTIAEIIATPSFVYYIDISDGQKVHCFDMTTLEDGVFIEEATEQFAVYGNYIFYVTQDEVLKRISISEGNGSEVANNVQRFFISQGLVLQSGKEVYLIDFDGNNKQQIAKNAFLVGADNQHIYFTNFGIMPNLMEFESELVDLSQASEETGITIQGKNNNDVLKEGAFALYAMRLSDKRISILEYLNMFIRAVYIVDDSMYVDTMK